MNWKRCLLAGILAGIVMNVISFLFGLLPGKSDFYTQMFPGLMSLGGLIAMVASNFLIGIFMGLIYGVVEKSLSGSKVKKGLVFGLIVFLLAGTMWPVMMMGFVSAYFWITELVAGLVTYLLGGLVVAGIYKK